MTKDEKMSFKQLYEKYMRGEVLSREELAELNMLWKKRVLYHFDLSVKISKFVLPICCLVAVMCFLVVLIFG